MTNAPTELRRVLERAEAFAGLLREYGNVHNAPTESELWAGCKDAAPVLADAARLLREMAADFEALTRYVEESDNKHAKDARARWRLP